MSSNSREVDIPGLWLSQTPGPDGIQAPTSCPWAPDFYEKVFC